MMKINGPLKISCTYIDNFGRIVRPIYRFGTFICCDVFFKEESVKPDMCALFNIYTGYRINSKDTYIVSLKSNHLDYIVYDED